MATVNPNRDALTNAELNALTSQLIDIVRRDETVRTGGIYARLTQRLQARARELEPAPKLPLRDVSDWLAVALFLENRQHFLAMCRVAERYHDPVYQRAKPWLGKIIEHDHNALRRDHRE